MMEVVPFQEIEVAENIALDNPLEIYKICREMEVLCGKKQGIGLSAVQVGIPKKLFVVKFNEGYRYFANCMYEPTSEDKILKSFEGCLSLPNRYFELRNYRFKKIRVVGYELVVKNHEPSFVKFDDIFTDDRKDLQRGSVVFQHEIDHQKGQGGLICNIKGSIELIVQQTEVKSATNKKTSK